MGGGNDSTYYTERLSPGVRQILHASGRLASLAMAGAATLALTANSLFNDILPSTRLMPVLVALILMHSARYPKILFARETVLYFAFFLYMLVELLWTVNIALATNTLAPALNFILVLILFGSLVTYHDVETVLLGALLGVLVGAASYTAATGFPLTYPVEFPYNAVSTVYTFGLFVSLFLACFRSSKALLSAVALIIWGHVIATTSIKANLGILIGGLAASLMYFSHFVKLLRRNLMVLTLIIGLLGVFIASNESLRESIDRGFNRVSLGIDILQSRSNLPGYSAFESRNTWFRDGLRGWAQNPVFGNGVESFRSKYGITSHSTPVDLLHNSGVIGFMLFYAMFFSMAWRLVFNTQRDSVNERFLITAAVTCFLFISLTGTMHYNVFLAAFIGISVAVLRREDLIGHH